MRRAHLPSFLEKLCWTLTGSATRHAQASGNAGGSSSESDAAQGCDPDDVDALELFCKPPSYYYEDGYNS